MSQADANGSYDCATVSRVKDVNQSAPRYDDLMRKHNIACFRCRFGPASRAQQLQNSVLDIVSPNTTGCTYQYDSVNPDSAMHTAGCYPEAELLTGYERDYVKKCVKLMLSSPQRGVAPRYIRRATKCYCQARSAGSPDIPQSYN